MTEQVTPLAFARQISQILDDEAKWTKGAPARKSCGSRVSPKNARACKFCITGAIERAVVNKGLRGKAMPSVEYVRNHIKNMLGVNSMTGVQIWNDSPLTEFKDVRALIDDVIAYLRFGNISFGELHAMHAHNSGGISDRKNPLPSEKTS